MIDECEKSRFSSTLESLQELRLSYYLFPTLCIHFLLLRNMLAYLTHSSIFPTIAFILFYPFNSLCFILNNLCSSCFYLHFFQKLYLICHLTLLLSFLSRLHFSSYVLLFILNFALIILQNLVFAYFQSHISFLRHLNILLFYTLWF